MVSFSIGISWLVSLPRSQVAKTTTSCPSCSDVHSSPWLFFSGESIPANSLGWWFRGCGWFGIPWRDNFFRLPSRNGPKHWAPQSTNFSQPLAMLNPNALTFWWGPSPLGNQGASECWGNSGFSWGVKLKIRLGKSQKFPRNFPWHMRW